MRGDYKPIVSKWSFFSSLSNSQMALKTKKKNKNENLTITKIYWKKNV